jgi:hypothetical protein
MDAATTWAGRRIGWRLLPVALLRTTGFSLSLLDPLRSEEAVAAISDLAGALEAVESARAAFEDGVWTGAVAAAERAYPRRAPIFRHLHRVRRHVQRGTEPAPREEAAWDEVGQPGWIAWWRGLLAEAAKRERCAGEAHGHALERAWAALREAFADERLQEAVFLSSPSFFEGGFRAHLLGPDGPPTYRRRATALTAHRYLCRMCARCETTSFFGPTLFAALDPACPEALRLEAPRRPEVVVQASAWLVEDLQRLLTRRLPLPDRPVRRSPMVVEAGGDLVRLVDGRRLAASPSALALWRAFETERTLGAAARQAGVELAALPTLLRELAPGLVLGLELPATELRPLDRLAAIDAPDGPAVALAQARDRFAAAPWPERRSRLDEVHRLVSGLGLETGRHAGAHYADRGVLHEDRASPLSQATTLGAPAVAGIQAALGAVLPLCLLGALLRREDAREALRAALDGQERPLLELVQVSLPAVGWRLERLTAALTGLVERRARDGLARLDPAEVTDTTADLWSLVPDDEPLPACLPSPDLMADGADLATATWVLSELHDDCSSIYGGFPATLHRPEGQLWRDFEVEVVRVLDPARMACIVGRRRSKHVTPEPPGLTIELSGRSGRPPSLTAPAAEVSVDASGRRLLHRGRPRWLYPGDLSSPLHLALALPALAPVPVSLGARTPRIYVGRAVVQRARWAIELPASKPGFGRWRALQELRRSHGLPGRVFVRHTGEPKPLLLDFEDPLSVDDVGGLPAGPVTMAEMLPDAPGCWWRPDGRPEPAELRLGCVLWHEHR